MLQVSSSNAQETIDLFQTATETSRRRLVIPMSSCRRKQPLILTKSLWFSSLPASHFVKTLCSFDAFNFVSSVVGVKERSFCEMQRSKWSHWTWKVDGGKWRFFDIRHIKVCWRWSRRMPPWSMYFCVGKAPSETRKCSWHFLHLWTRCDLPYFRCRVDGGYHQMASLRMCAKLSKFSFTLEQSTCRAINFH